MIENKVICGDCIKIMPELEDESIDLIVTSPPYNIGMEYDNYADKISWEKYYEWCGEWLKEIYRILKKDGRFCLNHYLSCGQSDNRSAPILELNTIARKIGFKHNSLPIWTDRTVIKRTAWGSWLSASAPYIQCPFEGILILFKNKWKKEKKGISTINKEDFIMATLGIWNIPTDKLRLTPATFPERLAELCINLLSYKDDMVLDPFAGSGTTGVVAKKLGRRYILIEQSQKYVDIINKRLSKVQMPLF